MQTKTIPHDGKTYVAERLKPIREALAEAIVSASEKAVADKKIWRVYVQPDGEIWVGAGNPADWDYRWYLVCNVGGSPAFTLEKALRLVDSDISRLS